MGPRSNEWAGRPFVSKVMVGERRTRMGIFYIIGVVVVVLAVIGSFGLG
jgi:hypothetical protein